MVRHDILLLRVHMSKACTKLGGHYMFVQALLSDVVMTLTVMRSDNSIPNATNDGAEAGVAAQVFLVLIALVAVPIMLLPKPLILQKRFKARAAQLEEYGRVSPHDEDEESGVLRMAAPAHAHEEEFDFGEVMVHQARRRTPALIPAS